MPEAKEDTARRATKRWHKLPVVCAVVACVLAFSDALVRYFRSGEVELSKIALALCFAGVVHAMLKQ